MAGDDKERRTKRTARSAAASASGESAAHTNGGQVPGPAQLMIDLDFVRGLIAAVDDSGIDTLEINRAGTRIRISKTPVAVSAPTVVTQPVGQVPQTAAAPLQQASPSAQTATETAAPPKPSNLVDVKSPMVGTFYRAPAPEAPSYVEHGSRVSKGQTLCILEAMKLMNELPSEIDGIVREILAENSDPVEYGQVLFRIEPSGGGA
jgi:acetyl-CoA carboxylase biotin carboxyl carrier protein